MKTTARLLMLLVFLAACSPEPGDDTTDGEIEYPMGADDLVLRISTEGGFVPVEHNLTRLPDLSLYGDGRLITQGPQILIYPGPALPNLLVRRLGPQAVEAVVEDAVEAGLTGPDRSFRAAADRITDLPDTVFTLVANGSTHRTSVYGFGSGEELRDVPAEEAEAIRELRRLRDRLTGLETELPEGSVGPEEPYIAEEMRIFVRDEPPQAEEGLEQPPREWPLETPLAEFGSPVQPAGYRCGTVEGEELDRVREAAQMSNQLTPWVSGGERYSLLFRPLLPDESGCDLEESA